MGKRASGTGRTRRFLYAERSDGDGRTTHRVEKRRAKKETRQSSCFEGKGRGFGRPLVLRNRRGEGGENSGFSLGVGAKAGRRKMRSGIPAYRKREGLTERCNGEAVSPDESGVGTGGWDFKRGRRSGGRKRSNREDGFSPQVKGNIGYRNALKKKEKTGNKYCFPFLSGTSDGDGGFGQAPPFPFFSTTLIHE